MGQLWASPITAATPINSVAAERLENENAESAVKKLDEKFSLQDGITLYTNGLSPCARRVKMTLIEKNVPFREVEVDFINGEQGCEAYRKINPNMKVPALSIQNVEGVPDVCLYESNVITEYLDAVFPGARLYPTDRWELAQCREWQDWELALTDDFVPVVYTNSLMAAMMKLTYSTEERLVNSLMEKNASKITMSRMVKGFRGMACGSREELTQHSIGILKSFLHLEDALKGKEYLVGGRFSIADLSVYPRVTMAHMLKITVNHSTFPNISRYLSNLASRKCFYDTSPPFYMSVVNYFSSWVMTLASWKTGRKMEQVNLSAYYERAKDEYKQMKFPGASPLPTCVIHPDAVVLFHYSTAAPCWQAQLLLKLKQKDFRVIDCDVVETIGRPCGTGGIYRIQHGGKTVTGSRGMLEYLDAITGQENGLYPSDPKDKAECLCWQAWEQTTYAYEAFQIYEIEVVSAAIQVRFPPKEMDSLLSLRSDANFSDKFDAIMKSYLSRLKKTHPRYLELIENYQHLKPTIRDKQKLTLSTLERLHERLSYLNDQLKGKKFLVGESVTIADCSIFILIVLLSFIGLKVSDRKYPNITKWMNVLRKIEEFRAIEEDMRHEIQRYIDECEHADSNEDFDLI